MKKPTITIQFAVLARSHDEALQILEESGVYRPEDDCEICFPEAVFNDINHENSMVFVEYIVEKSRLTDRIYNSATADDRIYIVYDDEALERSRRVLELCYPIEKNLKIVYMCILSGAQREPEKVYKAANPAFNQKKVANWYTRIQNAAFGSLVYLTRYDCLKNRMPLKRETIPKNNLWDKVLSRALHKSILLEPILPDLEFLVIVRNKAAHFQTITQAEMKQVEKICARILKYTEISRLSINDLNSAKIASGITKISPEKYIITKESLCTTSNAQIAEKLSK